MDVTLHRHSFNGLLDGFLRLLQWALAWSAILFFSGCMNTYSAQDEARGLWCPGASGLDELTLMLIKNWVQAIEMSHPVRWYQIGSQCGRCSGNA